MFGNRHRNPQQKRTFAGDLWQLEAFCFLEERISKIGWGCICITFIGSIIVSLGDMANDGIYGDILALLGAACVAIYILIGKEIIDVIN